MAQRAIVFTAAALIAATVAGAWAAGRLPASVGEVRWTEPYRVENAASAGADALTPDPVPALTPAPPGEPWIVVSDPRVLRRLTADASSAGRRGDGDHGRRDREDEDEDDEDDEDDDREEHDDGHDDD